MYVVIPDDIILATGLSSAEVRRELAAALFHTDRLTLSQASRLAGMSTLSFQRLLASRHIPMHYDVAEFEKDLATIRELNHP